MSQHARWTEWPQLAPLLEECCFQRWGRARVYVASCGHSVHLACWDTYHANLMQAALSGQPFDGRFAADPALREFVCPLCKTLANTLVPHVPRGRCPPAAAAAAPAAAAAADELAAWVLGVAARAAAAANAEAAAVEALERGGAGPSNAAAAREPVRRWAEAVADVSEHADPRAREPVELLSPPTRRVLQCWSAVAHTCLLYTSPSPRD